MKPIQEEEIKDAIIDHIYESISLQKQTVIKTAKGEPLYVPGNGTFSVSDHPLTKDEELKSIKSFVPDVEYVKLVKEYNGVKVLDSLFFERLNNGNLPFPKADSILELQDLLISSGYLMNNRTDEEEIKLTPKGVNHFEKSLSFKKEFLNQETIRKANIRSWISLIVAIASILITIGFKLLE
jgi:hypothetical protein